MPLPTPTPGQSREEFLHDCMGDDVMQTEFPDEDQRFAVCNSRWDAKDLKMKSAVLKVYGDIGEDIPDFGLFGDGVEMISAKKVAEFIDANADADEYVVRINSRGGDVQEGWAIYDLLTNSGKKIKTIGEGKIYSIATIVFLAGSEREIMRNADGLIHNPFIPPYTLADQYEAGDLLKIAETLKQEEEKILEFYVERTGTPKAKLAEYMKEETKLSAEDMLELGFATKILNPVVAYAYVGNNKNKVKMDEKAFFEKLGSALDGAVAKMKNLSRLHPKSMVLTDVDGNEFVVERETGAPEVGDAASPDGVYKMSDGTTITVEGGVITAITTEEMTIEEAKAKIATLEDELAALKAKSEEVADLEAAARAKEATAMDVINELTKLKNEWKPAARKRNTTTERVNVGAIDLDRVRELNAKLNPKIE